MKLSIARGLLTICALLGILSQAYGQAAGDSSKVAVGAAIDTPIGARTADSQPGSGDALARTTGSLEPRLDTLQQDIGRLVEKIKSTEAWSMKDTAYVITAIVAIFSLGLTCYSSERNYQVTISQMQRSINEEKAKVLQKKLDDFFGPLLQLRSTSELLYDLFRSRNADPANPQGFRTLTALLSGKRFEGNDKVLLDEIIKIGEETEQLIFKSPGFVDEELQKLLGKAAAHYRILRLAQEGVLEGEADSFKAHVFPRELDDVIARKIREIESQIVSLRTIDLPRNWWALAGEDRTSAAGH